MRGGGISSFAFLGPGVHRSHFLRHGAVKERQEFFRSSFFVKGKYKAKKRKRERLGGELLFRGFVVVLMQVMAHSKEAFRKAIRSGVPLLIGSATEERLAYRRDSHHSRRLALDGFLKNDTIPTRLSAFAQFIGDESDGFTVGGAVVFAEKFTAEQPVQHRLWRKYSSRIFSMPWLAPVSGMCNSKTKTL